MPRRVLLIALLLACVPASAHASERRAFERSMTAARKAIAAEVARAVARVKTPPPAWSGTAAPAVAVAPAAGDPPVSIEPPQIFGDLHLGGTAECSRGVWDDPPDAPYPVTYQWVKDGVTVATTPTLAIRREHINAELVCIVTAAGQTSAQSWPQYISEPYPVEGPRIVGRPYPGRELRCDPGEWNGPYELSVRWERSGFERTEPMPGVHDVYTVTEADVGWTFACIVTAEGEWEASDSVWASWMPVAMRITPLDDEIAPGADGGYTVTLRNPNRFDVRPDEVWMHLPPGLSYRPGSSTLGGEPSVYTDAGGQGLTWDVNLVVPAHGTLTFGFGVRAGAEPGDYYMRGLVYLDDWNVWVDELYETARITVEPPFTRACTITGTPGDDVLIGTPGPDVICGLGGDDDLRGLGGDDVLYGGDGDDRLDGGAGNDTLLGGDGEDQLVTGPGADRMRGGSGLDSVSYASRTEGVQVTLGEGDDDGEPGEGDDVAADVEIVRGGRGDDRLVGTPGDEELLGGAGDDEIWPGAGEDLVEAGTGDDFVDSGSYDAFTDRIFCGAGVDSYSAGDEDRVTACERQIRRPERRL